MRGIPVRSTLAVTAEPPGLVAGDINRQGFHRRVGRASSHCGATSEDSAWADPRTIHSRRSARGRRVGRRPEKHVVAAHWQRALLLGWLASRTVADPPGVASDPSRHDVQWTDRRLHARTRLQRHRPRRGHCAAELFIALMPRPTGSSLQVDHWLGRSHPRPAGNLDPSHAARHLRSIAWPTVIDRAGYGPAGKDHRPQCT